MRPAAARDLLATVDAVHEENPDRSGGVCLPELKIPYSKRRGMRSLSRFKL
jgi:hypothetical protein